MRVRPWVPILSMQLQLPAVAAGAAPALPLDLKYETPADCPSPEAFSAAVARLVGTGSRVSRNVTASVSVSVDRNGEFVLTLLTELDGIPGERVLRGKTCDSVADAAAVTLALLLNPDAEANTIPAHSNDAVFSAEPTPPAPAAAAGPTHTTPGLPAASIRPQKGRQVLGQPRAANTPLRLVAGASVGLDVGVMPQPSPELSLVAGLGYGYWSALASLHYAPPEDIQLAPEDRAGGRLWHGTLMALACAALSPEPPRVGACAGAAYTRVQGHGIGVLDARQGTTDWVSPSTGVFGDLALASRIAFRASAMLLIPANRPDAHLDDLRTVQRPGVLTAKLQAGVIIQVP